MGYAISALPILANSAYLQGRQTGGALVNLIGVSAANLVSIDPGGLGSTFGGPVHILGGNANSLMVDSAAQFTEIDLAHNGVVRTSWYWDETNLLSVFTLPTGQIFRFITTGGSMQIQNTSVIADSSHHAFGTNAVRGNIGVRFTLPFTSDGITTFNAGLDIDPTIIGHANDTLYSNYVNIAGFGITTAPAVTVQLVSSLRVAEPQLNVGAGGTVSDAYSVAITSAPTEGTRSGALWVASGTSRFDGAIQSTGVTFAGLPAGVAGMLMTITDSITVVWGAPILGGGAFRVLGYFDGTNWTVAGK